MVLIPRVLGIDIGDAYRKAYKFALDDMSEHLRLDRIPVDAQLKTRDCAEAKRAKSAL